MAHSRVSHVPWTRVAPSKRAERFGQGAASSALAIGGLRLGTADLITRRAVHKAE